MVLMLFTLGRFLEAAGRARVVRDLGPLLAAESECATVVEGGGERRWPVRELSAGMQVRVRPGERIPVDGIVLDGQSQADEAVITGESPRVAKSVGSSVIAGSLNLEGPLLIETNVPGNETRWAQICRSVRAALSNRASTQRVADRVTGVFVVMVLALACGTAIYWAQHLSFDRALLVGLAVLVVACPCAVGLAAPLAASLGIGRLARHGCIVRDAGALELLAQVRLLAFDKTGTLTRAVHALSASTARQSQATKCSHELPVWSSVPSTAWPAPSARPLPREAWTRSLLAGCRSCPAAVSKASQAGNGWRPETRL
jgi:P-type Cu2+ transporter